MPRIFDREAFLQEWVAATVSDVHQMPDMLARRDGKAHVVLDVQGSLNLKLDEHEAYIANLEVLPNDRRAGHAKQALSRLTTLAEKHGIDLVLHASPMDTEAMNEWELIDFYKKHGFIKCGSRSDEMFRPSGPA